MESDYEIATLGNTSVELLEYYCPHCGKLVMRGRVNRLNMKCPNCSELIEARGEELLKRALPEEE